MPHGTHISHPYSRILVVFLALALGCLITYLELARPSLRFLSTGSHQQKTATKTSSPSQPVATKQTSALTSNFVHMRATKSTSSPVVADLEAGTTIQLIDDADSSWQGVSYQGKNGYIYRAYLQY